MLTPDQVPEGWDATSTAYEEQVSPFTGQFATAALDIANLVPGERVLDVAAGTGALALQAARRGAIVLATDFSPGMVERLRARVAREGIANVTVEVMDGQALTVESGGFDAAFSNFGLIFFPDRARGFRELLRALRPGGRAVVTGWCGPERVGTAGVMMRAFAAVAADLPPPAGPPPVLSLADKDRFAAEMRDAGFVDVQIHEVTHDFVAPSPEGTWNMLTEAAPPTRALISRLDPSRVAAMRAAAIDDLRARFGDGEVRLSCTAHVGIGRAPATAP